MAATLLKRKESEEKVPQSAPPVPKPTISAAVVVNLSQSGLLISSSCKVRRVSQRLGFVLLIIALIAPENLGAQI